MSRTNACCHLVRGEHVEKHWLHFVPTPLLSVKHSQAHLRRSLMQVVYERCCGLDVHKKTVVACVLLTQPDGSVVRTIRTFSTMTADLLALSDWLQAQEVGVVALE